MPDTLRYLTRKKEWVSCLVLIGFTFHLIRSSALSARPLQVDREKPHRATTYTHLYGSVPLVVENKKKNR